MFWTYDVTTILSKFTRVIDNLEAAVTHYNELADTAYNKVSLYTALEKDAEKEADRAGKVAAKLRKLLETDEWLRLS